MKYLYLSLLSLLVVYLLVVIFIYFNQRNLLYHPGDNNYLDDKIQFSYKEVFIEVDQDINLKSWLIAPQRAWLERLQLKPKEWVNNLLDLEELELDELKRHLLLKEIFDKFIDVLSQKQDKDSGLLSQINWSTEYKGQGKCSNNL